MRRETRGDGMREIGEPLDLGIVHPDDNASDETFRVLAGSAESDSQPLGATDPTPDIIALENAAEQLTRDGHIQIALPLWRMALQLREAHRAVT